MELIDWARVARGALWIGGLSVALAAWSYAFWRARDRHVPLQQALARPRFQVTLNLGLAGFALGLAWGAATLWERLAWLALAIVFAWQAAGSLWKLKEEQP